MNSLSKIVSLFPDGLYGIIFDCDGVMIDSLEANRQFYNIILHSIGQPPMTLEQEEYAFMATAKQAFIHMLPEKFHPHIEEIIQKNIDYDTQVLPKIKLMPGFLDFIEKCDSLNLKMAIDTNRTDLGIEKVLQYFNIEKYFTPVISSSQVQPKPSGEGVKKICTSWNLKSDMVLFIGDSKDDEEAAKNGGVNFAAFGDSPLKGDIKIKNFKELEQLIIPFVREFK